MSSVIVAARDVIVQDSAILDRVRIHLSHPDSEVRLAAAWLCNNMAYSDDDRAQYRRGLLHDRGLVEALRAQVATDPSVAVRERCSSALDQYDTEMEGLSPQAGAS